jgi:hypothetical protein
MIVSRDICGGFRRSRYVGSIHGHELSQGWEHDRKICAIRSAWQIVAVWELYGRGLDAILYVGKPEKKHTLKLWCRWQCNIIATSWRSTECADLRFVWLKLSSEHEIPCECLCKRWHTERNQNLYLDLQIIVRCTWNCNIMWLETCILKNGFEYSIMNPLNSFKHNCSLMSGVTILVPLRACVGRSILAMYKIAVI